MFSSQQFKTSSPLISATSLDASSSCSISVHNMLEPDTTFKKYFPHENLPQHTSLSSIELQQDLFWLPISINSLASEILQPKSCRPIGASIQRSLKFAHISNLESWTTVVGNEFEVEDEEQSYKLPRKPEGRNTWNDMPKFLVAGAVSTIISRTCVAPLERIKLECIVQGSKDTWLKIVQWIWVSEGLRGFWKGNSLNLFRMVPFKSINFICYDMYLNRLQSLSGKKEITNRDRLISGGISGVVATVLCIPLDTIRTRLVASGGKDLGGVVGCIRHMIHKEGFLSLYKGLTPALISMGPASAIFYAVYDILKTSHLSRRKKGREHEVHEDELGVVSTLIYGAIAGACAETVTYPLEVIRRQLQLQRSTKLGLASSFVKLIETDGVASLFAGVTPSTLQVLPSAALSYYFYELMKSILKIS